MNWVLIVGCGLLAVGLLSTIVILFVCQAPGLVNEPTHHEEEE